MKLYDKIIKCLEHGVFPIVLNREIDNKMVPDSVNEDGEIFFKIIGGKGNYFDHITFDDEQINDLCEWTGEYYTFPRKPYEVGQKVKVRNYTENKINKNIGFIESVVQEYPVIKYNVKFKGAGDDIIYHARLVPVFEEEEDKDHECDWVVFQEV